eukprot:Gregarina_sp_Poly_1__6186@NODE_3275_length_1218_cov_77_532580_g2079_i0_p2_GENE_NODE_3275_length_1218_cov_77_532580_g2079_i0NODE_3275_length_1218_cov_77_532580_g2079_i0_p2_ORF_typecomplete_len131_score14_75Prenyltrans/PF00432_21/1_6e09Prenyltrans/PF00432_21/3_8e15Prenyltrans/PF00432_21/4_4e02SQHop_cyclase_N/PF13249_6/0_013SQHop_cyclase_N/PF13249_6/0_45_NODE_3275_length_1218_cov_77_532580_g2079_i078470
MGHCRQVTSWVPCFSVMLCRKSLRTYLLAMKTPSGGFRVHDDGEMDMRGTYCAIASASMTGILDEQLAAGVADYIKSCQGYDGGIAGMPGAESHAGYTYCGLASLCILDAAHTYLCLPQMLVSWEVLKLQ